MSKPQKPKNPYPLRGNEKKLWLNVLQEFTDRVTTEEGFNKYDHGSVELLCMRTTKAKVIFSMRITRIERTTWYTDEEFELKRNELTGNRECNQNIDRIIQEIEQL